MNHDERESRHRRHAKVGDALSDAGDEWAVVCWFYSAYHIVRAQLLIDPIFGDPSRLAPLCLIPDDRLVERHKGRRRPGQPPEFGVNDLVHKLYREIQRPYERLHIGSVDVRYKLGCKMPLGRARECLDEIEAWAGARSVDPV